MLTTADLIRNYFECYGNIEEVREIMQQVIDTAISSPEADSWDADDRADMIFFCKQTVLLIGAVHQVIEPIIKLSQLLSEPAPDKSNHSKNLIG